MSSVQKYFNALAWNYSARSQRGLWAYLRKKEKQTVLKATRPFSGMNCLELGCGSGYYTSALAKYSPLKMVAVDFSFPMIANVNQTDSLRVCGDICNIAFRSRFDRIVCAGALEFLPNLEKFLSNTKTLLAEKGLLVLLLPRKGIWGFFYKIFHRSHGVNVRLYDFSELESILESQGWKLDSLESPIPMTSVLKVTHGNFK